MKIGLEIGGRRYASDTARGVSLAIPLSFDGAQPSFFEAPAASARPLEVEGFTGDTRRGGSCNVGRYDFTPHCNGTHTECVSHVTDEPLPLAEQLRSGLLPATLVTVVPKHNLIEAAAMKMALQHHPAKEFHEALILRTVPNTKDKLTRHYLSAAPPPCVATDAAKLLVDAGVMHLLVDLPSLDPMHDEGRLAAHRVFWGLPEGNRHLADAKRAKATVTEMIYVPDAVHDGYYLLDLQIPAFMTDAAPSRPVIFPLESK